MKNEMTYIVFYNDDLPDLDIVDLISNAFNGEDVDSGDDYNSVIESMRETGGITGGGFIIVDIDRKKIWKSYYVSAGIKPYGEPEILYDKESMTIKKVKIA
jgi:hypothetical protein